MQPPDIRKNQPSQALLGIDTLYRIKKDPLRYYESLHDHFGDVVKVRLGTHRCWFLFHPEHIEQVLAKQASKFIRFERIMKILRQWNGESLLISEGNAWKERRRKVLPAFKQQRMPGYAKKFTQHANDLTQKIASSFDEHKKYECNIDTLMAQYALDIAGMALFSKTFSSQAQDISDAVHHLSEIAYKETTSLFTLPQFLSEQLNRNKKRVVNLMKNTISDIVGERMLQPEKDKGDLLSILISHHKNDANAIEEDVMSLLIAGHETSGATLSWLFLLLAKHQDILKRVHEELDTVIGNGILEYNDLKRLPYLTAVIQETLRLYPAAYALFCRQSVSEIDMGSFTLHKGDLVQLLPYITQCDERWFSAPNIFNPDRFMQNSQWPQYAYFPFGAGPRVCIGQSFGMIEIMITAASVLYKMSLMPIQYLPKMHPRFSLRPYEGSNVTFYSR